MDKRDEAALRGLIDTMPAGTVVHDLVAPAVYQLDPVWMTAILCRPCSYIGLVMSLPSRAIVWRCPRCSTRTRLEPPRSVLFAPRPKGDGSRASRLS